MSGRLNNISYYISLPAKFEKEIIFFSSFTTIGKIAIKLSLK